MKDWHDLVVVAGRFGGGLDPWKAPESDPNRSTGEPFLGGATVRM